VELGGGRGRLVAPGRTVMLSLPSRSWRMDEVCAPCRPGFGRREVEESPHPVSPNGSRRRERKRSRLGFALAQSSWTSLVTAHGAGEDVLRRVIGLLAGETPMVEFWACTGCVLVSWRRARLGGGRRGCRPPGHMVGPVVDRRAVMVEPMPRYSGALWDFGGWCVGLGHQRVRRSTGGSRRGGRTLP